MNLGRAKSILIIAFAGLNIFLGYYLFWPDFGRLTKVAVTAQDLHATEVLLNDNNYTLEASPDRSVRTSDFLTVSPALNFQGRIVQHFIGKGAWVSESENTTNFQTEGETVIIHSSGLMRVVYDPGILLAENAISLDERELRALVKQFLDNEQLMPEGLTFDYMEKSEEGRITFHHYQLFEGTPIYASQLKVVVDFDYIELVEIYWLNPIVRVPPREMEVISATEALSNLVHELGPSSDPRKVEHIELGYFSGEYDAQKWEVPPVWRIVLDGKQYYYINAFTGNIEQDNVILEQAL